MSVCVSGDLFVPSAGTQNRVDWRLLVKESIDKVAKLRNLIKKGDSPVAPVLAAGDPEATK